MKQRKVALKEYRKLFPVFIIVAALAVAAAIIAIPVKKPKTEANQVVPRSLSECTNDGSLICYTDYIAYVAKSKGPQEAISELKTTAGQNEPVKGYCHQLAHAIGHEAYKKYGSLSEAFTHGDSYCWSGYYHGVTESAVGAMGPEQIRSEANTICSELADNSRYSFDHFNCVHGLGHGFMTVESFNLFSALKTCDLMTDSWEQSSCYGGVFMENVMVEVRGDGTSAYLKSDDLMYPCTAVDTKYKTQCYQMQTSHALQKTSFDFQQVAGLCQNLVDSDFIPICFQSLGRDASGSTNSDIVLTKEKCQLASSATGIQNCMIGAVKDIISYFHDDKQARQYCNLYEGSLVEACLAQTESYYATFNPPKE